MSHYSIIKIARNDISDNVHMVTFTRNHSAPAGRSTDLSAYSPDIKTPFNNNIQFGSLEIHHSPTPQRGLPSIITIPKLGKIK